MQRGACHWGKYQLELQQPPSGLTQSDAHQRVGRDIEGRQVCGAEGGVWVVQALQGGCRVWRSVKQRDPMCCGAVDHHTIKNALRVNFASAGTKAAVSSRPTCVFCTCAGAHNMFTF